MDRIRAGLTGLGAVLLVTAAASLLFAPDEAATVAAAAEAPGEPLAQLGVAPGSDPGSDGAGAANAEPADALPPGLEAQPSGGPFTPDRTPATPSPVTAGLRLNPDRPVTI